MIKISLYKQKINIKLSLTYIINLPIYLSYTCICWIWTTILFFGYLAYKKFKTGEKKRDLKVDAQKEKKIKEMTGHYSYWNKNIDDYYNDDEDYNDEDYDDEENNNKR